MQRSKCVHAEFELQQPRVGRRFMHSEFLVRWVHPSAGPPHDEFLETDVAVALGIGNIEIEQAFFP